MSTDTENHKDTKTIPIEVHEATIAELRALNAKLQARNIELEKRIGWYQELIKKYSTRHERVIAERNFLAAEREARMEGAGRR